MLKKLLLVLLLSIPFASFGQQHVLFRDSTTIDSFRLTMWVRQLIPPAVPKINPFFDSVGSAYLAPNGIWWRHNGVVWQPLTTEPDSNVWATLYYVDSGLASISAGAVDTNNYISSIARLNREIDSVSNIIDSNNAIIYGSLSDLYDTKADKDTLGNFVLHTYFDSTLAGYVDTALLNDSLSIFRGLFVPYTGATANVNLGSKSLTTNKVLADTLVAKSSMGIHMHGTGGQGIMVGAGGGGNVTFDAYPISVAGDSVLTTNSSGGLLRYDLKSKLYNYLLKSDSTIYTSTGKTQKVADSLGAIIATKGSGTVTSIQLVGGTGVTITPTTALTTSGVYTISATGGGGGSPVSASPFNMLYKSSTDTIRGTDKLYIDTTDNRLVFTNDTTTTTVNTDPNGGTKVLNSNRMGMSALRLLDTVSIPAALQRAINAQTASLMFPLFPGIVFTNNYLYTGMLSTVGTPSYVVAAYNSTIQHFNWNKYLLTTASGANSNALIRTTGITSSAGIICGNTKYSGGGGRGTFMFSLPTYLSTQRIMIGYVGAGVAAISADPSSMVGSTSSLLLIKDASDATLSFMHTNTSGGAATKVNTGITPNSEDVYRLTVYIAPNSTYYMQLEVLSKSAPARVVTINPTTNIPPVGSRMVSYQGVNNGSAGGVISYGIIQVMEEIY